MKKRPEDHILSTQDPEKFRCPYCNPNGWNRTGMVPAKDIHRIGSFMWGSQCLRCIDGWREYEDVELY